MNNLSTKLFKLDVNFFKKNFLNTKEWGKIYTVFETTTFRLTTTIKSIDTVNKALRLEVKAMLLNVDAFIEMFERDPEFDPESLRSQWSSWNTRWEDTVTIPLVHEEFTQEVFERKFIGTAQYLFRPLSVYSFSKAHLPLIQLESKIDARMDLLQDEAIKAYKKVSDDVKDLFSEDTFIEAYVDRDSLLSKLKGERDEIENELRDSKKYLRKDFELFLSFFGVDGK